MDSVQRSGMTPDEFLAWEAGQELRWEFDGVRPVAMNGGTAAHNMIRDNVMSSLRAGLRGGPCRWFGLDMRVRTTAGRYRYPDALVTCSPVLPGSLEIEAPVVIFEVLSESTSKTDRTTKLLEYKAIASFRRYVMIEQDEVLLTVLARDGDSWSLYALRGGESLSMPEIGMDILVDYIYAAVWFTPE